MSFDSRQQGNQNCAEREIQGVLNRLCVTRLGPRNFRFSLTKINNNPFAVILSYNTTQRFDFAVRRVETGREVWRWSFGVVFAPVMEEIRLRPGQSTTQSVEWPAVNNAGNPVPSGRYVVRGENLARVRRVGEDGGVIVTPEGGEAMAKMPQLQTEFEFFPFSNDINDITDDTSAPLQPKETHYTVQPGDTLESIAKQFGLTVNTLKSLNSSINASNLKVGQLIKVR